MVYFVEGTAVEELFDDLLGVWHEEAKKLNNGKTINKLPVAGTSILVLHTILIWILLQVIQSWYFIQSWYIQFIHTGIIDLHTNLAPANNFTSNKLY